MVQPKITKLTSSVRVDIQPNSTVDIVVKEKVFIPEEHYGKFFIRKRLGQKSLLHSDSPFPPSWIGNPTITINNTGPNLVEIREGDELGELYLTRF